MREDFMALALGLAKLSPEATKGLIEEGPVARAEYFRKVMEGAGGKVLGYYLAEGGDWDVVSLVDLPETQVGPSGVAAILSTQANGLWARNHMIRLYTPEEVQSALTAVTALRLPGSSE
jgi:uncharacterized protein with GYD domain